MKRTHDLERKIMSGEARVNPEKSDYDYAERQITEAEQDLREAGPMSRLFAVAMLRIGERAATRGIKNWSRNFEAASKKAEENSEPTKLQE